MKFPVTILHKHHFLMSVCVAGGLALLFMLTPVSAHAHTKPQQAMHAAEAYKKHLTVTLPLPGGNLTTILPLPILIGPDPNPTMPNPGSTNPTIPSPSPSPTDPTTPNPTNPGPAQPAPITPPDSSITPA